MPEPPSLEDRVLILEWLLNAILYGPHLEDVRWRQQVAQLLYTQIEAAQRHRSLPPHILSALTEHADALAELDNVPDALRPALRPLVPPPESPE